MKSSHSTARAIAGILLLLVVAVAGRQALAEKRSWVLHERTLPVPGHGPVVLARTTDPRTGQSVLRGRRVTALTKLLERSAYLLTMWTLGRHFRTYPEYVQDEVIRAIGDHTKFERGPMLPSYSNPFTLTDGNLITARWPGDSRRLGEALLQRIQAATQTSSKPGMSGSG